MFKNDKKHSVIKNYVKALAYFSFGFHESEKIQLMR